MQRTKFWQVQYRPAYAVYFMKEQGQLPRVQQLSGCLSAELGWENSGQSQSRSSGAIRASPP